MSDANFDDKLEEILHKTEAASAPHQDRIINLTRKSKAHHDQLQQKLSNLQNSLDYLRLSVKYLIFDLEATRRENTELRKRISDAKPRPENDTEF